MAGIREDESSWKYRIWRSAKGIEQHHRFNTAIMCCIMFGSIMLALDKPGDDDVEQWAWASWVDTTFTLLFTFELAVKVIALGLGPGCGMETNCVPMYFLDPWNWLDFVVVVEGWITMLAGSGGSSSGLKVTRLRIYLSHEGPTDQLSQRPPAGTPNIPRASAATNRQTLSESPDHHVLADSILETAW